jgi:hypothetical protein
MTTTLRVGTTLEDLAIVELGCQDPIYVSSPDISAWIWIKSSQRSKKKDNNGELGTSLYCQLVFSKNWNGGDVYFRTEPKDPITYLPTGTSIIAKLAQTIDPGTKLFLNALFSDDLCFKD